jgi:glycosyltransferase involved in cell wall biosynthesis
MIYLYDSKYTTMNTPKKKILLGITKMSWGGAQRYVYDLALYFAKVEGHDVVVIGGGNGSLLEKLKLADIRTISIPSLKRDIGLVSELRSLFFLCCVLIRERPHIFHSNSSKMGLFGAILGRLCRVPHVIFTAHAWAFHEERKKYQKIIFRLLAMITVALSHRTITVSNNMRTSLKAPPFIERKMTCVYLGIHPLTMYDPHAFFEMTHTPKTPGVNIVSIGELHTSKGFDRALIALSQCRHLKWTYHIMGVGEKKEYLLSLVEKLGIKERVFFHGFIENAPRYLNSFDLFLFPSRTEALGYVGVEALYSKLPILASNAGGIPEVLFDDPYTMIIDCSHAKIFKESLFSFLKKRTVVDETKRPGRLRFTMEFMFAATKKIYSL